MENDILQMIDRVQYIESIIGTIVLLAIHILGIIGAIRTLSSQEDINKIVKTFCVATIIICFLCGLTIFRIRAYNDLLVSSSFLMLLFDASSFTPFVYLVLRYYKKYKFDKLLTISMFIWIANIIWQKLLRNIAYSLFLS